MPVNVTDGRCTDMRAAARADNTPLIQHFVTPTTYSFHNVPGLMLLENPELGQVLPYAQMPVLRCPWSMKRWSTVSQSRLFDIEEDPDQLHNLMGTDLKPKYVDLLRRTMAPMDSPSQQYTRLGL